MNKKFAQVATLGAVRRGRYNREIPEAKRPVIWDFEKAEKFFMTEVSMKAKELESNILTVLNYIKVQQDTSILPKSNEHLGRDYTVLLAVLMHTVLNMLTEGTYGYSRSGIRVIGGYIQLH